jgi:hypothetical protein
MRGMQADIERRQDRLRSTASRLHIGCSFTVLNAVGGVAVTYDSMLVGEYEAHRAQCVD